MGTYHPQDIRYHYVNWLSSFSWDTFVHLTWRRPTTIKLAKRHIEKFLGFMGGRGIFGFEWGPIGGLLHVHGLVEGRSVSTEEAWRWWFEHYGRNAIQEVDPAKLKAGVAYICKYSLKDDLFEFLGAW